ncbi:MULTISPECIES: hypothetical protein [Nitrosomonas]|uniref:hypothetical protein n=1 Tax=Nitrosomonas TaxID=914 RepID=UPI000A55A97A|nr:MULTISPECIES: hypothetical protein [Nitrosomonas]UVS60150.1 hypothetical protein NX761_11525 [Nitrosomonas sp. PLL12]
MLNKSVILRELRCNKGQHNWHLKQAQELRNKRVRQKAKAKAKARRSGREDRNNSISQN